MLLQLKQGLPAFLEEFLFENPEGSKCFENSNDIRLMIVALFSLFNYFHFLIAERIVLFQTPPAARAQTNHHKNTVNFSREELVKGGSMLQYVGK